jgi:hypothetical protein
VIIIIYNYTGVVIMFLQIELTEEKQKSGGVLNNDQVNNN